MTKEILEAGNELLKKLDKCKENLNKVGYTQSENVVIRKSYLSFNGVDNNIEIPESLFRVIGKLVQSEYIQKVKELERKLEEL